MDVTKMNDGLESEYGKLRSINSPPRKHYARTENKRIIIIIFADKGDPEVVKTIKGETKL